MQDYTNPLNHYIVIGTVVIVVGLIIFSLTIAANLIFDLPDVKDYSSDYSLFSKDWDLWLYSWRKAIFIPLSFVIMGIGIYLLYKQMECNPILIKDRVIHKIISQKIKSGELETLKEIESYKSNKKLTEGEKANVIEKQKECVEKYK